MPNFDHMHAIDSVIGGVTIPRFLRVRQHFSSREVTDVGAEIRHSMEERQLYGTIKPGSRVVIAVGSRQIANLAVMVKGLVDIVKERQAHPFIMPAMGSHGGATAEGQAEILDTFGINEAAMGVPILSAMEVSHIGDSENGDPVWVASHLLQADAVIIVNRVKPHPAFSGPIESGITKMSVIGLGKQKGAEYCHQKGLDGFSSRLQVMNRVVFRKLPIIFGVAILENPYDRTAEIHCIPADQVAAEEPKLLERARQYMPQILLDGLDVLIVDEIGKNISGTGADPNVMCRFTSPYKTSDRTPPTRIVMRDLTPETHGAAAGMGQADFITRRLYEQIDYGKIYVNSLTSTLLQNSFTPLIMPNDEAAIKAAIKTCCRTDLENVRIVRIKNTLEIGTILVSEALLPEIENNPAFEILSQPFALRFDENGELIEAPEKEVIHA
jgi:hypothetical protein